MKLLVNSKSMDTVIESQTVNDLSITNKEANDETFNSYFYRNRPKSSHKRFPAPLNH